MTDPKPVIVEWTDTGEYCGDVWDTSEGHAKRLAGPDRGIVRTIGYLMHEDEDRLLIALSHDPINDQYLGVQAINIEAVQLITRLT